MAGAMDGVRVLDLTTMISGPLATMILGDQGADVIKVESPPMGDIMRYMGTQRGGLSALCAGCNRSKRSIVINLKAEAGKEAFLKLVAESDVVVQNFRPGVADRLGIGYEALRAIKPDLIYVSISGFGETGPRAQHPVYDNIIQGMSGIAAAQSDPETGKPDLIRNLVCDKVTALTAAQAISAALFARERGAGGQHLKLAMLDSALAFFWSDGMMDATIQGEGAIHMPTIASQYRALHSADGFMSITVVTDEQFRGLCEALDIPGAADDPRFGTIMSRMQHLDEIMELIEAYLKRKTTAQCCEAFIRLGVPHAAINSIEDVFTDPQIAENGIIVETNSPVTGQMREARPAAEFGGTPSKIKSHAPGLGEQTSEVLAQFGYGEEEIAAMRKSGAVR